MHEINKLSYKIKNELWNIKRYCLPIDFKDLVDFYTEYESCANLVVDTINSQVIQYDGVNMPFSKEDILYMIEAFITFNQYNYNRLIVDTLIALNNSQVDQYLSKILGSVKNKKAFVQDYHYRFAHFEEVKGKLMKLGIEI